MSLQAPTPIPPHKWQPQNNPAPDRRHSTAGAPHQLRQTLRQQTPSDSRRGSGSPAGRAGRKSSEDGATPAWYAAIKERDSGGQGDTTPPPRRKSSLSGLLSLRRKSEDNDNAGKPRQVVTSRHSSLVRNLLKVDPRSGHRQPANRKQLVTNEGIQHYSHLPAAVQEARHPHSGPPGVHPQGGAQDAGFEAAGHMLARIVSMDEPPDVVDGSGHGGLAFGSSSIDQKISDRTEMLENVHEHSATEERLANGQPVSDGDQNKEDGGGGGEKHEKITEEEQEHVETRPRRKSLLDVEIKAADRPRRKSLPRMVFGGWHKDDKGNWTRK